MNRHTKIVFVLVILAAVVLLGGKYLKPFYDDWRQQDTSDARGTKGTIRIGMDNWVGYFPLCSNESKRRMRRIGYLLQCEDDHADYNQRMTRMRRGDLEMAVATVDSYLISGAAAQFPGTIAAVIDESKGGDAILAWADRLESIDSLKQEQDYRVALTPDSASAHLLKSIASHFDIPRLRQADAGWRVDTDGSEAALKLLLNREVEAAVLWEPDVSRALEQEGIHKILGTEDTEGLIVDILVVNRRWSESDPEAVYALLSTYFQTLKYFRDNPQVLRDAIAESYRLKPAQVEALLEGVSWTTLGANASQWFGVKRAGGVFSERLIDAIESASEILVEAGDFASNPVPNQDPYRITNSQFVADLYNEGINAGIEEEAPSADSLGRDFSALDDAAWDRLREVGTLKIRPIVFQSGSAELAVEGRLELDRAAENLRHYPHFRIVISGHSGLRGNAAANQSLSQERATSVTNYLREAYQLDRQRLRAVGHGSGRPLPRRPGESDRAYNYRLPRVELALVSEEY